MKRAGDVSARFGLHPDTVRDWVDMFEEFFSSGARRGGGGVRREFTRDDEIVVNTIRELRLERIDFEEIRARLAAGERRTTLPPMNEPIPPETALAVYNEMRELKVQITERDKEIERLRAEAKSDREEIRRLDRENAVLQDRLARLEADKD